MAQYFDYNSRLAVPDKLFTPLHGVKLTGGLFRKVFDNNIRFNQRLDHNRMDYWFDVKMGRRPKGERYAGHFEDNLKGQTASQYLMCAGNVLRWEENAAMRRGLERVLDTIQDAAEDDGFMMPIDKKEFATKEYPGYTRIWLTYGLVAAARAGDRRAFPLLRRWQDWFNECPDLPMIKYTVLAFQGVVASPYVYTTEVGRERDMEICRKYYEETWRLGQFALREKDAVHIRRQPGAEPHPHGSELEAFEGYLDIYRWCGAPYILNAVEGCWELYMRDWRHPGGGIVMCEAAPEAVPGCNHFKKNHHYNELCCTSFWLHLNQRLHRLFPDEEKYVNEMEQSLYNVAIANQNGDTDIRYFAYIDEKKSEFQMYNHCCSGVGTRIFASLPEYLFTMNRHTLSADIYADCELAWETVHQTVKVTEKSGFPCDGDVSLRFDMEAPEQFDLRVRIPAYATGDVDVKLNGRKVASGKPGSYVVVDRIWYSGDEISFVIPMGFEAHPYTGVEQAEGYDRCAYTYGPLLMSIVGERNSEEGTVLAGRPDEFIGRLTRRGPELDFAIEGEDRYFVRPYYQLQTEEFVCYPMFSKA